MKIEGPRGPHGYKNHVLRFAPIRNGASSPRVYGGISAGDIAPQTERLAAELAGLELAGMGLEVAA